MAWKKSALRLLRKGPIAQGTDWFAGSYRSSHQAPFHQLQHAWTSQQSVARTLTFGQTALTSMVAQRRYSVFLSGLFIPCTCHFLCQFGDMDNSWSESSMLLSQLLVKCFVNISMQHRRLHFQIFQASAYLPVNDVRNCSNHLFHSDVTSEEDQSTRGFRSSITPRALLTLHHLWLSCPDLPSIQQTPPTSPFPTRSTTGIEVGSAMMLI